MRDTYMDAAMAEARRGMRRNEGGPFGAVIVRRGRVISRAHNQVLKDNDPTAHAEVLVVRRAARRLGRFHLPDCELYTTCEPCPMCLSAVHWARIRKVHYACTRRDAARIGFADEAIYRAFGSRGRKPSWLKCSASSRKKCLLLFREWMAKTDKVPY